MDRDAAAYALRVRIARAAWTRGGSRGRFVPPPPPASVAALMERPAGGVLREETLDAFAGDGAVEALRRKAPWHGHAAALAARVGAPVLAMADSLVVTAACERGDDDDDDSGAEPPHVLLVKHRHTLYWLCSWGGGWRSVLARDPELALGPGDVLSTTARLPPQAVKRLRVPPDALVELPPVRAAPTQGGIPTATDAQ